MSRHERKLWAAASTLDDLGELMARWLEGDLQERPGYFGPTDLDTPELAALCAGLCRSGFVTDNSQQGGQGGGYRGRPYRARDAIDGFCGDAALNRLFDAVAGTGLVVSCQRTTRWRWGCVYDAAGRIPVTEFDGRVCTEFGGRMARGDLAGIWDGIGRAAWREVRDAWHVGIVDAKWGRTDLLIPTLTSRFLAGAR